MRRSTPRRARTAPKLLTAPVKDTAGGVPVIVPVVPAVVPVAFVVPVVFVMSMTLRTPVPDRQMRLYGLGQDKCHG